MPEPFGALPCQAKQAPALPPDIFQTAPMIGWLLAHPSYQRALIARQKAALRASGHYRATWVCHSCNAAHAPSHPSARHANAPAFCAPIRYSIWPGCHLLLVWSARLISQTKDGAPGITTSDAPGVIPSAFCRIMPRNCPPRSICSLRGCIASTPSVSGYSRRRLLKNVICSTLSTGHLPRKFTLPNIGNGRPLRFTVCTPVDCD